MQPSSPKLLEDIRDAAVFILDSTRGLSAESYAGNRMLRQSVERNFEIMGEAVQRLRRADPETAAKLGDEREIVAFRNVLVHGYDSIDHTIVWDVIRLKLPELLARVRRLLGEAPEQP